MVGIIYPISRSLDLGWRLGCETRHVRFRRLHGCALGRRLGGFGGDRSLLGPRIGKYSKDGKVLPIPGHSMALATLGVFVLWFGWFGFNPGSTMAADAGAIGRIAVATNTAAAAAAICGFHYRMVALGQA